MKGLLWNCRGVSQNGMGNCLKNLLHEFGADVVGLQETMKKKYTDKFFRQIDPNKLYAWHWLPAIGRSGGILCGAKLERFDVLKFENRNFSIAASVFDKKMRKELLLVTVYGPAHDEQKEEFLTELANICASRRAPMLIGGDFNILRFSTEKNKKFIVNKYTDLFNSVINSFNLRDLALNGGKFTWSNNQADPTLEKLDRILMSDDWEGMFPLTNLRKIPRHMSDHSPLLLCTEQEKAKKTKAFCFETAWIKHTDFLPKMQEIWGDSVVAKNAVDKWYIKINRVKKFLKGWGQNLRGQNKRYRNILQSELAELELLEENAPLSQNLLDRKTFIQTEMLRIQEEEELYWHKRSNLNWLLKGDCNTDYFHKVANGKRRKNMIYSLQHNDSTIEGDEEILKHATNYYRDLFGPSDSPLCAMDPDSWDQNEKVNPEENEWLTRPFTEEEIKKAVFSMEKNTAPGPDHLPVEFYQACWDIVKNDFMEMILEFEQKKLDTGRLCYGNITLIPKIKEANKIQQYRPICLLNVSYKIITKVLMLRLEHCLGRIINKCQTAFLKGRNVMEGVLSLHEILHDAKIRGKEGLILKLDFEKAHDKLCWKFLFDCFQQRGFSPTWCSWIKEVVTCGTLSVKANDMMGNYFKTNRGVRQGDPLSPLLFNLAADSLAKMINKAQENGLIKGMIPEYIPNGVAILQYADDTILCLEDDEESAQNMKFLLYMYEKMSGLKINFSKSEVIMVTEDVQKSKRYSELMNCSIGSWPIKYLGVPVSGSRLHIKDWLMLDEKLLKRLEGWKVSNLSLGGRLVLINSCLSSIPTYCMSMFLLPKTILKRMDSTRKRFFWQGTGTKRKYYLVKWSKVTLPKRKGGLGIKDLRKLNISLLSKWWWKIESGEGLWQEIVQKKYIKRHTLHELKARPNNSPVWNDLLKVKELYLRGRIVRIGNGLTTDFWRDAWCGLVPLKEKFPELFAICNESKGSVAWFANNRWRLTFRRWLDCEAQTQLRRLNDLLLASALSDDKDFPRWIWENSGLLKQEEKSSLELGALALKEAALHFHPQGATADDTGIVLLQ
ncbi:unnamed protein product [Urochloa humidicola]